jgi:allantoin racemase
MRFMYICPVHHDDTTEYFQSLMASLKADGLLDGIEFDMDPGPEGPGVRGRADLVNVSKELMDRVHQAVDTGRYDAIVIQGFLDPVLLDAREVSPIPVLGCGESSYHLASLLGHRFSIIDTLECMAIMLRQRVEMYGLGKKLASVRSVEYIPIDVMEGHGDRVEKLDAMEDQCLKAIEEDGADTIILGCSCLSWMEPEMKERLRERGYDAPLIVPIRAAVSFARVLVTMGMRHSPLAYPPPIPKPLAIVR